MENFMPLAFSNFGQANSAEVGQTLGRTITPFLAQMTRASERVARHSSAVGGIAQSLAHLLTNLIAHMVAIQSTVQSVRVMNLDFLEIMALGSYQLLLLIYLRLAELIRVIEGSGSTLTVSITQIRSLSIQITMLVAVLQEFFRALLAIFADLVLRIEGSLTLTGNLNFSLTINIPGLEDIDFTKLILQLGLLALIGGALAAIAPLLALGLAAMAAAVALLAGALALLAIALHLMPDNIKEIATALAILAVGLGILAAVLAVLLASGKGMVGFIVGLVGLIAFLYLLAGALHLMPENLADLTKNLLLLGAGLGTLAAWLSRLEGEQLKSLVVGLLALAGFMLLLGVALRIMPAQIAENVTALQQLFTALTTLAERITEFEPDQLKRIGAGFLGIVLFVGLLGLALRAFPAQVQETAAAMQTLFQTLTELANTITGFSTQQLQQIGLGFLAIVAFVALLGLALQLFPAQSATAIEALGNLFTAITNLANAIASFTPDQLIQIGLGFLGIALFVGLLGGVLSLFQDAFVQAGPALAAIVMHMNALVITLANLDIGQLIMLGIGLALLVGFVAALGAVATITAPGLTALANALNAIANTLGRIIDLASRAASALSSLPSISLGGITDLLPSFDGGGIMPITGPAMLHAGERVLTPEENRAYERGFAQPAATAGSATQQTIDVGGITISITAQSVDQDAVGLLSDEIVAKLQERLSMLGADQNFRTGTRTSEV